MMTSGQIELHEQVVEALRVRDELLRDLDATRASVRWLRSELRTLERLGPTPRVQSVVCVACGLGALVGAGVAMWAR